MNATPVHLPPLDTRHHLEGTLRLTKAQAAVLWPAVEIIVHDLTRHAAYVKATPSRAARIQWLQGLSKSLERTAHYFARQDPATERILRSSYGAWLGRTLSHAGVGDLLGGAIPYGWSERELDSRAIGDPDGVPRIVEYALQRERTGITVAEAPQVLQALIAALGAPIRRLLEIERQNKGGSPGKLYRNYTIQELIPVHQQIYDAAPTATPKGPFISLCELIIVAIGLDSEGTDKAAARILADRRVAQSRAAARSPDT